MVGLSSAISWRGSEGLLNCPPVLKNTAVQGFRTDSEPPCPLRKAQPLPVVINNAVIVARTCWVAPQPQGVTRMAAKLFASVIALPFFNLLALFASDGYFLSFSCSNRPPWWGPLLVALPAAKMTFAANLPAMRISADRAWKNCGSTRFGTLMVFLNMLGVGRTESEVFNPVIPRDAVDMMNAFAALQLSVDMRFYYKAIAVLVFVADPAKNAPAGAKAVVFGKPFVRSRQFSASASAQLDIHAAILAKKEVESTKVMAS